MPPNRWHSFIQTFNEALIIEPIASNEAGWSNIAVASKSKSLFLRQLKKENMGLLTPKGKKGDKKNNNNQKNSGQQSKFLNKGGTKPAGGSKKQMPGSANRGS